MNCFGRVFAKKAQVLTGRSRQDFTAQKSSPIQNREGFVPGAGEVRVKDARGTVADLRGEVGPLAGRLVEPAIFRGVAEAAVGSGAGSGAPRDSGPGSGSSKVTRM